MTQKELEKKIKEAQDAYSNSEPIMSDIEFDMLWDQLQQDYPESKLLKGVAVDHTDGFKKHKHKIIMGSQNKANTATEMNTFLNKYKECVESFKLDGCSIALEYVNGKFMTGSTRGDGSEGDDITSNVLLMNGLVKTLKDKSFTGTVRGEVLLFKSVKEKYFPDMKNCRNAAAGIMKHLDGADCDKLNIMVYNALYDDGRSFETEVQLQTWLETQGFEVSPWSVFNGSGDDAVKLISEVFSDEGCNSRDYDIDGIVFKKNVIDMNDVLTEYRPKTQIALKPAFTPKVTVLRDIDWSVKNGTITPVAIFDPVEIEGSIVQRASLDNIAMMEQLGIEIGHTVTVIKANMIIPKIIKDNVTGKFVTGYEF